jgi:uncharacterized RDD family membrane protein YckC
MNTSSTLLGTEGIVLPKLAVQESMKPAGFWIRVLATIIDGVLLGMVMLPFSVLVTFLPYIIMGTDFKNPRFGDNANAFLILTFGLQAIYLVIYVVAKFFYFGWFYKNKGASPGKMVLKLKVVNHQTGQNIGYGKTFLRDFLGKFVSGITLGIGYLMVAFREDKRALHDLIADTQVMQRIN